MLILGTCENDITRSMAIWEKLESKGFRLKYIDTGSKSTYRWVFTSRVETDRKVPSLVFFHAAFCDYLMSKFKPRMVCLFHTCDVTPSLMRRAAAPHHAKTIYIPHAVNTSNFDYTAFDFDYYFVFGQSSIENARLSPVRLGQTKFIKAGSPFIRSMDYLQPASSFKSLLFFSNFIVGKHPDYTENFHITVEWARLHPEYTLYIKLHPLENEQYVSEYTRDVPNVKVLDKKVGLKESLERVFAVITTASNAAIEAAVMNRPVIVINRRQYRPDSCHFILEADKYLCLEKYFLPRARNSEELNDRINEVISNYDYLINKCKEFVKYHLERETDAPNFYAEVIHQILDGKEVLPYEELEENVRELNKYS